VEYFKKALFIYDEEAQEFLEFVEKNSFGVEIESIFIDTFLQQDVSFFESLEHIVVTLHEEYILNILQLALQYDFSIGIVPLPSQKEFIKNIYASNDIEQNLDIALQKSVKSIDLIQANKELVYSQGVIGFVPLIGKNLKKTRNSLFKALLYGVKKFFSIELQKFEITTANGKKVVTAGSAVIILNHTSGSLISKIFNIKHSMRDGEITIVIVSPFSVFEYIKLLATFFAPIKDTNTIPEPIGYMKSKSFKIKASRSKKVVFENSKTVALPLDLEILPEAVRINASEEFWKNNEKTSSSKETIKVANLPDKNEANKYMAKHIPLFSFASEDRFKELFQVLRLDAKLNHTFLALMVLSTILATLGLFANSAAVIIGAMLVAPLMTPIVSVSMGLLRGDTNIIRDSLIKIVTGVFLALAASSIMAYLLPYSQITPEMKMRINPTLLDLGVAILSGVIAAYAKSFKEIIQNLAGVAIAVALVPPLAVAGIGLGYGEFTLFSGAFLLFFTNLVGIIIAAVMTFNVLGFSSVVKSKKSVLFIFALLLLVSYPLYISYDQMITKYKIAHTLKQHRFIVNNKYIIIQDVKVNFYRDMKAFNMKIVVREALNRKDLEDLKVDIERLFGDKIFIKTEVEYIL